MVVKTTPEKEKVLLRAEMLKAHKNRELTKKERAERLGMSVSGFLKLYARYRESGCAALTHGLCGKPPTANRNRKRKAFWR